MIFPVISGRTGAEPVLEGAADFEAVKLRWDDADDFYRTVAQMDGAAEKMNLPPRHQAIVTRFFSHSICVDSFDGRLVVASLRPK